MGYQFPIETETTCDQCGGSGVVTTTVTVDTDGHSWVTRGLSWLGDHIPSLQLEKPCTSCNGSGTVEETRDRRLTELTDTQLSFLYNAQLEREKAKWGGDESAQTNPNMPEQIPSGGGQMPPSGATPPSGGPPMGGSAREF